MGRFGKIPILLVRSAVFIDSHCGHPWVQSQDQPQILPLQSNGVRTRTPLDSLGVRISVMQITSWPFQDFMESSRVSASGDIGLQSLCKHGA